MQEQCCVKGHTYFSINIRNSFGASRYRLKTKKKKTRTYPKNVSRILSRACLHKQKPIRLFPMQWFINGSSPQYKGPSPRIDFVCIYCLKEVKSYFTVPMSGAWLILKCLPTHHSGWILLICVFADFTILSQSINITAPHVNTPTNETFSFQIRYNLGAEAVVPPVLVHLLAALLRSHVMAVWCYPHV